METDDKAKQEGSGKRYRKYLAAHESALIAALKAMRLRGSEVGAEIAELERQLVLVRAALENLKKDELEGGCLWYLA